MPGSNGVGLPEDELVEIVVSAISEKWTSELFRLQFRFEESNWNDLKEKLERLELCERLTGNAPDQKRPGRNGGQDNTQDSLNGSASTRGQRGRRGKRKNKETNNTSDHNGGSGKKPCILHRTTY